MRVLVIDLGPAGSMTSVFDFTFETMGTQPRLVARVLLMSVH
jgi:hypothetical protein